MHPPPAGSVEEDAILLSVPDGRETKRSRPVQAEENAARFWRSIENLLGQFELIRLEHFQATYSAEEKPIPRQSEKVAPTLGSARPALAAIASGPLCRVAR